MPRFLVVATTLRIHFLPTPQWEKFSLHLPVLKTSRFGDRGIYCFSRNSSTQVTKLMIMFIGRKVLEKSKFFVHYSTWFSNSLRDPRKEFPAGTPSRFPDEKIVSCWRWALPLLLGLGVARVASLPSPRPPVK